MECSFIEYVQVVINQNWMFKFLEGFDLKDFCFVGIFELMDEDLQLMVDVMGWIIQEVYQYNVMGKCKWEIIFEEWVVIEVCNVKDLVFYQEVMEF